MNTVLRGVMMFFMAMQLFACEETGTHIPMSRVGNGVTDTEVVFGSSLALEGHTGYLGRETLRGAMCYLNKINAAGGVHGRRIRLMTRDDAYDPPRCLDNTQKFLIRDQVFGLFGYVGTPTTVKILPLVEDAGVPLLGMFTGADALREPFSPYLINVRASYYQETSAAVAHFVQDMHLQRIAVFYQYDAFGFDGLTGTELALKRFGLEPVARGSFARGTLDIADGLERIRQSRAEAVVMIGTSDPCARFIRAALDSDFAPIFYMVSFVGAKELVKSLEGEAVAGRQIIMSQVVPPPVDGQGEVSDSAREFVQLLRQYYPGEEPTSVGFEGYINARVLVEALQRAGRDLTRRRFLDAISSMRDFSLGRDLQLSFGPDDHQGMDSVYFTRLDGSRFVQFADWSSARVGVNP